MSIIWIVVSMMLEAFLGGVASSDPFVNQMKFIQEVQKQVDVWMSKK